MKITYLISSAIFAPLLIAAMFYAANTWIAIYLICGALLALWIRITCLIPAYLAEVKTIVDRSDPEGRSLTRRKKSTL